MKKLFIALGILVLALLAYLAFRPAPSASVALPAFSDEEPAADGAPGPTPLPETPGEAVAMPDEFADIPLDPEAIASLRGGRVFGDPRTPPIERSAPQEQATAEELADPEKYAEYEARQEKKLKRAYVVEAEKYITQLREDIAKGKAMGIPPDEIAKVEKKVKGIEEMRAKLLKDDPTLVQDETTH